MPDTSSELTLSIPGALTLASTAEREVTEAADVTDVVAVVGVAPTGADLLLDVLKNGTTIFGAFGTIASKSAVAAGDTTFYVEMAGNAAEDIRQGQMLLIDTEQVLVSGQVGGSSKVDAANPVYAVPVTRAQNGTAAAAHAAGATVSPAKPRIPAGQTKSALTENGPLGVTPTLASGDVVSVAVTQIGSTVAGSNLDVTVELSQR
jgi:hypothetical protein